MLGSDPFGQCRGDVSSKYAPISSRSWAGIAGCMRPLAHLRASKRLPRLCGTMLQYLTGVGPLLGVIALTIAWGFLRLSTRRSDRHAPPPPRPFWLDGALIALFKGDLPDASVVSHQRGGPVYGRYFLGRDTVYVSGTFRSGRSGAGDRAALGTSAERDATCSRWQSPRRCFQHQKSSDWRKLVGGVSVAAGYQVAPGPRLPLEQWRRHPRSAQVSHYAALTLMVKIPICSRN